MLIVSMIPSNLPILSCPFLILPSILASIRVFLNELALCIRWPKYCRFSISASNEYSGLISFSIDWFNLFAVQGTLKSLQHHSSKASILQHSAFFMVQLAHPYTTTGKTIVLNMHTFVAKVMSLFFNTLSRFVSFPCKEQLSFNFMVEVTVHSVFGTQENNICHCFHFLPIYLP